MDKYPIPVLSSSLNKESDVSFAYHMLIIGISFGQRKIRKRSALKKFRHHSVRTTQHLHQRQLQPPFPHPAYYVLFPRPFAMGCSHASNLQAQPTACSQQGPSCPQQRCHPRGPTESAPRLQCELVGGRGERSLSNLESLPTLIS